jgi:rhamnulokinase
MASFKKFLAFDLGAESGRGVIGLFDGKKLKLEEINRFPTGGTTLAGSLYWDVLRMYDEMKRGIKLATESYGSDIAGMGIDTWGVDFGLLGPNDVLLENPHCYRDSRIDGMMEAAEQEVGREYIYEQTGIQFMPINTLYHVMALARQNRWMLDIAKTMLLMADLFNFFFTGMKVCEFTNATTTQFYNPREKTWARQLLERLDIPTHFLPEVVSPGIVLGDLRPSIVDELDVPGIPVIAPATHDTGSAVAAVPAETDGYAYISSGTWSLMGIEFPEPIINEKALQLNFTNEGGVAGTFRVLKNIMGLWLVQECRRTWAQQGREFSYSQLVEMAEKAEPFRSLVDPDDVSFLKPGDMPSRIREFCRRTNQPIPEDEGQVIRTALDSLALKYRWVLERLEVLVGRALAPIHIVGGGIQNRLLCQLTANVTGKQVVAGPVEATAIGNVLVQALAIGVIGSIAEGREIVRKSFELVTYDPNPDPQTEEAYSRFVQLLG